MANVVVKTSCSSWASMFGEEIPKELEKHSKYWQMEELLNLLEGEVKEMQNRTNLLHKFF